jgi:hypothetical protein
MFQPTHEKEALMKSSVLWGLVGLNAVLLFAYIGQFTRPGAADAQVRRPSDYLLIPGEVSGGSTEIVYVVDTTTGRLGGVSYDDASHMVTTMPPINLNTIFSAGAPAAPNSNQGYR